jgi:hypothetical protein
MEDRLRTIVVRFREFSPARRRLSGARSAARFVGGAAPFSGAILLAPEIPASLQGSRIY